MLLKIVLSIGTTLEIWEVSICGTDERKTLQMKRLVRTSPYSISPLRVLGLRLVLVVVAVLIGIRIVAAPACSDLLEKRSTL